MKNLLVVLLVLVFSLSVIGQNSRAQSVDDLGWMSGCWKKQGKTAGSFTMEHWTKPAGMMLGLNQVLKDGRIRFFEYLRIIEKGSTIYYVAKPANAKTETYFKLTSLENKRAVFENPKHDFPQRIIYRLADKKTIAVRVEAEKNGTPRGFGFSMNKVSCE